MTPSFEDVPEHWKAPQGPYRQAPAEYGAGWWLVNPFTAAGGAMPWELRAAGPKTEKLPEGFEEIFGARPRSEEFHGTRNPSLFFQAAMAEWEQNLAQFRRAGLPEWAAPEQVEAAGRTFAAWGMGRPRFYEGRYGWSARFPESALKAFEVAARGAVEATHLVVAQYQLAMLDAGRVPAERHPFVPAHVWPGGAAVEEEN